MHFYKELQKDIEQIETIYDLAAYCYDYLITQLGEKQATFIAEYIWENDSSKENNPNLELMREMQQDIKNSILKQDRMGVMFEDFHTELCDLIQWYEEQLQDFGREEPLNHAVIPFFIIKGLELYIAEKDYLTSRSAPLNENYQVKSYVYLNEPCRMMMEVAEVANFGSAITPNEIRNEMDRFVFLEKREIKNTYAVPKVVTLNKNRECINNILQKGIINVAVIPFSRAEMLDFPITRGAVFEVEYKEWHKQYAQERALKLLCEAVAQGANIIVFPEFICSSEIQEAISEKLSEMYDACEEKLNNLLLVVAGSGWIRDSNNVSKIYSYNGIHLGDQYKYSSFTRKKGKDSMVEGLSNPGGATTVIRIPEIGNIQVGICRDISESTFAHQLARLFSPIFLLVPAWSSSVERGFNTQLRTIVSENYTTCGVLCNCCEARDKKNFERNIGIIVTPYKNKTIVDGKKTFISRNEEICAACLEHGCIFMCTFDFGVNRVLNVVAVTMTQVSI